MAIFGSISGSQGCSVISVIQSNSERNNNIQNVFALSDVVAAVVVVDVVDGVGLIVIIVFYHRRLGQTGQLQLFHSDYVPQRTKKTKNKIQNFFPLPCFPFLRACGTDLATFNIYAVFYVVPPLPIIRLNRFVMNICSNSIKK